MTSSARCWTVAVRMEIFNSFGSYVNGLTEGKAVYNEVRMFLIFIQHGSHEFYSEVIFTILIPGKLVVKFDWSVQILTEMWFFFVFWTTEHISLNVARDIKILGRISMRMSKACHFKLHFLRVDLNIGEKICYNFLFFVIIKNGPKWRNLNKKLINFILNIWRENKKCY